MKKNAVETEKEVKIVEKFGLKTDEMNDMFMAYQGDLFNLIRCAFNFGYLQGSKAEKMIRKENVV